MTYDKFYEILKSKFRTNQPNWGYGKYKQEGRSEYFWTCGSDTAFYWEWQTGGVGGGNCWNDGGHYGLESDPEPEMKELDEFLKQICPDLPFWKYKELLNIVVTVSSRSEHEYYGNRTNYSTKTVPFRKLYNTLDKMGVFK